MLRELKVTDVETIFVINKEALGYSFNLEDTASQFAKLSQDSHHYLLGYEDDTSHELLGYVHAEVYESLYSKAGFNILALAVLPETQVQGIGRALLKELEKETKRRGYEFIRLNSTDHRIGAHAFYERVGYTCDKVQKRFIKLLKGEDL